MRRELTKKLFNDLLDLAIDKNLEPGDTLTVVGPELAGLKVKIDITFNVVSVEDGNED